MGQLNLLSQAEGNMGYKFESRSPSFNVAHGNQPCIHKGEKFVAAPLLIFF